jgi:type IV secretion system protein VirB10
MSEQKQEAPASPDTLNVKGDKKKGRGVRRLNKLPIFALATVLCLVVLVVTYTMYQKAHPSAPTAATAPKDGAAAAVLPVDFTMPTSSEIPADRPVAAVAPSIPTDATGGGTGGQQMGAGAPHDSANDPRARAWQNYYQQKAQFDAIQRQTAMTALTAKSTVNLRGNQDGAGQGGSQAQPPGGAGDSAAAQIASAIAARSAAPDPNAQAAKRSFLDAKPTSELADYLAHTRRDPVSQYEVKAGAVIPATMISGLNSDLPGQIIAQVSENVYDTGTGHHLLIPQGSRLVGTYDNGVTLGQTRALTAWRRIIYPDATSLDLDLMPGADQSGYAGFHDQVNNHYGKIFGNAALLSVFSAGIQLSQPQASGLQNISTSQTISGALGQQLGQLGMEMTRKNMDIQPTIQIRPGYQFVVHVTKDMIIKPWGEYR